MASNCLLLDADLKKLNMRFFSRTVCPGPPVETLYHLLGIISIKMLLRFVHDLFTFLFHHFVQEKAARDGHMGSPSLVWVKSCISALGGLSSFLHDIVFPTSTYSAVCQCPKRASFISTPQRTCKCMRCGDTCQCPKRASFISTHDAVIKLLDEVKVFQCPNRAFFYTLNR